MAPANDSRTKVRGPRTRPAGRSAGFLCAVLALVLVAPHAASASVSSAPDSTVQVNGKVFAIAQVGDRTIIAGQFTAAGGQARDNVAAILADGSLDQTFDPRSDGPVYALAGSADGSRIVLGGAFTQVDGAARANLAAVDATGELVTSWQADTAGQSPDVKSLAIHGERVYVGGKFAGIDGAPRRKLAAVDLASGDVILPFRPQPNGGVFEVVTSPDGTKVYAGGGFTSLGGLPRSNGAAELSADSGVPTAFDPSTGGGRVITVALSRDGSQFYFSTSNNTLFRYDPAASNEPVWAIKTSGDTQAIGVSETEVYIGGHFSQITTYKVKRAYFASLYPADGTLTPWDPKAEGGKMGVWAIELTESQLLTGGVFKKFDGVFQKGFARFSGTP